MESDPGWGMTACLPWDEAIFGFPVADLSFDGAPPSATRPVTAFAAALRDFCHGTNAELVSARAAGADTATQAFLGAAGFVPVDFSLLAQIPHLKAAKLPKPRFSLRPAEPNDYDAVCLIASTAFAFGRYHGDRRFPRALANRRYAQWVRRALDGADPDDHVLVLGPPNSVVGFMNVVIRDGRADLRLGAVDPENKLGFAGFSLYSETLLAVYAMGARSVSAKVTVANTRVLNVCAMLGCRFSDPQSTYHWHAPNAAHLLPAGSVAGERP
jgi:ribosomal protein S18 acetylase RimI-like enzyme